MPGWADVADVNESVTIRGQTIPLVTLSIGKDLAGLFAKFPTEMKEYASNGTVADEAVVAIIAAGTGATGDEVAEKKIAGLTIGEKSECLLKILKANFPGGAGPFAELVSEYVMPALRQAGYLVNVAALDTSSEKPQPSS